MGPARRRLRHTLAALAPTPSAAVTPGQEAKRLNPKAGSRTSVCWGLKDGEGSSFPTLTKDDVEFFAANGFLLKKVGQFLDLRVFVLRFLSQFRSSFLDRACWTNRAARAPATTSGPHFIMICRSLNKKQSNLPLISAIFNSGFPGN